MPVNLPFFDFLNRSNIREILKDVYYLKEVKIGDTDLSVLGSRFPHIRGLFNQPFAMCDAGEESSFFHSWDEFKKFSRISGRNIVIKSLSDVGTASRVHAANCPVLEFNGSGFRASYRSKFRTQLKRHHREAIEAGVTFSQTFSEVDLLTFYREVLVPTYREKHRMLFQPYGLIYRLFKQPGCRLYIAKRHGRVLGGVFCTASSEGVHYNWGAMKAVNKLGIGGLLLDSAIEAAEREGKKWFDLGLTPLTHDGLLRFKTRFGPHVWPVYHYYTLSKPKIMDYHSDMPFARSVISRVPESLLIKSAPLVVPLVAR